MRNLLVGNGVNIQFDKVSYSTKEIVLRILKNCDRKDFPSHIIVNKPYLIKNYIGRLFLEARKALQGYYDEFTNCSAEASSLVAFKEQYSNRLSTLKMTDIGFEDYYLIHDLVCHKFNIKNPEQYHCREGLRTVYLWSIYNDGKIDNLYHQYSEKFVDYLKGFDSVFTTNYDSNIDCAIGKEIYHIHGWFKQRAAVYDYESFRNQLPDAPVKDVSVDENYYYLYSNALTTHCGAYKEFQLKQYSYANEAIAKLAAGLKYVNKQKVITGLKRISKPGLRVYATKDELPKVLGGLGIALISTSKGIMTDKNARKEGIGGEVLAFVW